MNFLKLIVQCWNLGQDCLILCSVLKIRAGLFNTEIQFNAPLGRLKLIQLCPAVLQLCGLKWLVSQQTCFQVCTRVFFCNALGGTKSVYTSALYQQSFLIHSKEEEEWMNEYSKHLILGGVMGILGQDVLQPATRVIYWTCKFPVLFALFNKSL